MAFTIQFTMGNGQVDDISRWFMVTALKPVDRWTIHSKTSISEHIWNHREQTTKSISSRQPIFVQSYISEVHELF